MINFVKGMVGIVMVDYIGRYLVLVGGGRQSMEVDIHIYHVELYNQTYTMKF